MAAQENGPSIEALLKEATSNANKEKGQIASQVKIELMKFKFKGNASSPVHAVARDKLIGMGFGAIPYIIGALKNTKNAAMLVHLHDVLIGMHKSKTATTMELAGPLRNLIDTKEPLQAAVVISVLGTIGDEESIDAIRLQNSRDNPHVKSAVLLALAKFEAEGCFEALEAASKSDDRVLRKAAAQGYALIGRNPQDQKAMVALVEDPDDEVAMLAIVSLSRISGNSKAMIALHDTLKHENPKYVRVAIAVIEEIGKKEYSSRHLLAVVKNDALPMDLRTQAAKALFNLKDKDGMVELAKPLKKVAKNQSRSVRAQEALGRFYLDFGAWELAAKSFSKALDLTRNSTQQNTLRLEIARCYARAENFKRAASYLKKTGRENYWQDLVDDLAFAKMKEDKRYRKNFYE